MKTYSASTGLVYQYFYCGYRETGPRSEDLEYVFQASEDRKQYHPISVIVSGEAMAAWAERRGREIIAPEKYAVAKMSLFAAFDNESSPLLERRVLRPDAVEIDQHLETLGRL